MASFDKTQEVILRASELRRETEDMLLAVLRTTLRVVATICRLAEQEAGEERARHRLEASQGLQTVKSLAEVIRLTTQDQHELEEVRRAVLSLSDENSSLLVAKS